MKIFITKQLLQINFLHSTKLYSMQPNSSFIGLVVCSGDILTLLHHNSSCVPIHSPIPNQLHSMGAPVPSSDDFQMSSCNSSNSDSKIEI